MYAFLLSAAKLTCYTPNAPPPISKTCCRQEWRLARTEVDEILQKLRQTGNLSQFSHEMCVEVALQGDAGNTPPRSLSPLPGGTPFKAFATTLSFHGLHTGRISPPPLISTCKVYQRLSRFMNSPVILLTGGPPFLLSKNFCLAPTCDRRCLTLQIYRKFFNFPNLLCFFDQTLTEFSF